MTLTQTRFGTIEFTAQDIITFAHGLIGFEKFQQYLLVPAKPGSPFSWLQSLQDSTLAFLVADPNAFFNDYAPEIGDADATELGLDESIQAAVMVTASIPKGSPQAATANLAAPVVINLESRQGKQVVLSNEAYTMRHPIFSAQERPAEKLAA